MRKDPAIPENELENPKQEFASYCVGGIVSLLLTATAFAIVALGVVHGAASLFVIGGLAALQVVVQLKFLMHIDLKKSHRDDLQLILFTALILALMVGGTIWILFNQHARMM